MPRLPERGFKLVGGIVWLIVCLVEVEVVQVDPATGYEAGQREGTGQRNFNRRQIESDVWRLQLGDWLWGRFSSPSTLGGRG